MFSNKSITVVFVNILASFRTCLICYINLFLPVQIGENMSFRNIGPNLTLDFLHRHFWSLKISDLQLPLGCSAPVGCPWVQDAAMAHSFLSLAKHLSRASDLVPNCTVNTFSWMSCRSLTLSIPHAICYCSCLKKKLCFQLEELDTMWAGKSPQTPLFPQIFTLETKY